MLPEERKQKLLEEQAKAYRLIVKMNEEQAKANATAEELNKTQLRIKELENETPA